MYFAQYGYNTTSSSSSSVALILFAIYLLVLVLFFAAGWRIFTKAGEKGWKILIPVYNTIVLLRLLGLNGWLVLVMFIPFVNILFAIYLFYKLAQAFGHGIGMTILCLIFGIG